MAKAKGIMNVDLNNPLALKYMNRALQSWQCISDLFEVVVVQCVTPDTLIPNLNSDLPRGRSPQELAAFHSHYRVAKRIQNGERIWMMEHDAYLKPEGEEFMRTILSKWLTKNSSFQLGMANEFWTTTPTIAEKYCTAFEQGWTRGPMGLLHRVTDVDNRERDNHHADTYWPANRFKNKEWTNKTGLGIDVNSAYNEPRKIFDSPVTQILDESLGGTVIDTGKPKYIKENHPDVQWVTLD